MASTQRFEAPAYALLRIVTGFLFLWHGSQKLFHWPPSQHSAEGYVLYIGGPIELVGGLLVMLGLFTRPAAFLCSGMMAVAYWMAHGLAEPLLPVGAHLLPLVNRGELAVLYCFVFLFIFARGAGIWSIDSARG